MKPNEVYWLTLVRDGKIKIFPGLGMVVSYLQSPNGRVLMAKSKQGYCHASAGPSRKERYYIQLHELIWLYCCGEIPSGFEPNHINGNKTDNRIENLELVTRAQNMEHSFRVLGQKPVDMSGERNPRAILTEDDVRRIRFCCKNGVKQITLAKEYNVSKSTISAVINDVNWKEGSNHSSRCRNQQAVQP